MKVCSECKTTMSDGETVCVRCGSDQLSDPEDKLDDMVAAASVPNLATLFRKAKASGAIGSVSAY
jgi:uncharacterized paraquat-inducible protein A